MAKVYIGECDHLPHGTCTACFAEALESFAAEAVKEALSERGKLVNQIVYEEARNEGIEECAKIVDNSTMLVDPCDLARAVRALKSPGGK